MQDIYFIRMPFEFKVHFVEFRFINVQNTQCVLYDFDMFPVCQVGRWKTNHFGGNFLIILYGFRHVLR